MPACAVMSRKWICWQKLADERPAINNHRDTETRRNSANKKLCFSLHLGAPVVNCVASRRIISRPLRRRRSTRAGLCPAGQPERLSLRDLWWIPAGLPIHAHARLGARYYLRDVIGGMGP